MAIFIGRNIDRIVSEHEQYGYKPIKETFYHIDDQHFIIQKEFNKLISNFDTCQIKENECLELKPKIIKTYKKYIFINN